MRKVRLHSKQRFDDERLDLGPDALRREAILLQPRHQGSDGALVPAVPTLVDGELLVMLVDRKAAGQRRAAQLR